jgi:hypothetical protein
MDTFSARFSESNPLLLKRGMSHTHAGRTLCLLISGQRSTCCDLLLAAAPAADDGRSSRAFGYPLSMKQVIYLSFVASSVSFTITDTRLFLPVREWVRRRSRFSGELLSCGCCFCHWVAIALVATYKVRLFESSWSLLDYFLTALIVAWLSAFQWIALCWLMGKTGK